MKKGVIHHLDTYQFFTPTIHILKFGYYNNECEVAKSIVTKLSNLKIQQYFEQN